MMLVSEYATEVINTRPYKYQTRQTFFKDLKRLGIWDLEVEQSFGKRFLNHLPSSWALVRRCEIKTGISEIKITTVATTFTTLA